MDSSRNFSIIFLITTAVIITIFFSSVPCFSEESAVTADKCIVCHEDVWRDVQNKRYIHKPVIEKDCKYCHVDTQAKVASKRDSYTNKVVWVARSLNQSHEHWLAFDGNKGGATLVVESRSSGGNSVSEFPLPPFDEIEELPVDDIKPLKISNIRLLEVNKGVFVSVTIGWDTNRPADSQVIYGSEKLDQKSNLDAQYTMTHAVTLTGVKLGKIYKYKVVSFDLVGNGIESNVQTLVPEVVPGKKSDTDNLVMGRDTKEPTVAVRFYRKDNKCIVMITSEQLVNVAIGVLPKKYENHSSESDTKVINHLQLSSPEIINSGVCYSCHLEYKKILTHPINVYPKRGMIIPQEYPTLPDGRISCMSCHSKHASDIEFRLIKSDRRELCRGCHKDIS